MLVELLADDPGAAAELGTRRAGCSTSRRDIAVNRVGKACAGVPALDRLDEADDWAGRAAEIGASDDAMTQMLIRQVRAKVLARRGETAEAEPLAREAVEIGEGTDMINMQGDAYMDLGECSCSRKVE